jgi:biotin-(acetyl-CoA carboxylase) ligase
VLHHQPVAVLQGSRRITGTAGGIDDAGSLIVRDRHGRTHRFTAGEVTLEKAG